MSRMKPLNTQRQGRSMTSSERQRDADSDWALANYDELVQRYPGEYLAVWRKQVIDHGTDPDELLRRATTSGRPQEEVVIVAFPDPFSPIPH